MTNILRGLNATVSPSSTVQNRAAEMGESLFAAPSVFSYFSPQNRIAGGLLGPEFQIYSTQTASDRADLVNTALYGALDSTTTLDLSPFAARTNDMSSLLDYISYVFLHSSMSSALTQAAASAFMAQSTAATKARAALFVVLTSSEYQVVQ
jgi:hypothetical protein